MKRTLSTCLLSAGILSGCATVPAGDSGVSAPSAAPRGDPAIAAPVKSFGQCKAEASAKNLPVPAYLDALFECARAQGGKRGEACFSQLLLNKIREHDFESEMAHCLRMAPAS